MNEKKKRERKKEFLVTVEIHRTYRLTVEADNEDDAYSQVADMQTTEIAEKGSLQDVEVGEIDVEGV